MKIWNPEESLPRFRVPQRIRFSSEDGVYIADSANSPGYALACGWRGCTGLTNVWIGTPGVWNEEAKEAFLDIPAVVRFTVLEDGSHSILPPSMGWRRPNV